MAMTQGIVLSDLHLFAPRSDGFLRMEETMNAIQEKDVLILNGDTFDFRWSTIRPQEKAITQALNWVQELRENRFSGEIHFILGNHDCIPAFVDGLAKISDIHCHDHLLALGKNLFLHGDCANRKMNLARFQKFRSSWANDRPKSGSAARAYDFSDSIGLSSLFHKIYFPTGTAVRRVVWHLDQVSPDWRGKTEHVFFGHTHLPFEDFEHDGIRFHNTGSAIQNMEFLPLNFEY